MRVLRFSIRWIVFLLAGLLAASSPRAEEADRILAGAPPPHPRLFLREEALAVLAGRIKAEPRFGAKWAAVCKRADQALAGQSTPAAAGDPDRQHRHAAVLKMMRGFMDRLLPLALAHRLTGEDKYRDGAVRELERICALERWGDPGQRRFDLCTGEISAAVGIAYDWLANDLPPGLCARIRAAARANSFRVYLDSCDGKGPLYSKYNHNPVDNGGAFVLAAALWGEVDLAPEVAVRTLANVRIFLDNLPPDGGYAEGTMYWGYAFMYLGYLLGAAEAVPGLDLWTQYPILRHAAYFPLYLTNGYGQTADFCDANSRPPAVATLNLFAQRFGDPLLAAYQERYARSERDLALQLIWLSPEAPEITSDPPPNRLFPHLGWAVMRAGWGPDDLFLAVKGGDNKANHSHLDLGSFALASGGRWYTENPHTGYSTAYFNDEKRWLFYAASTAGQNTVVIGGGNQDPSASAPLTDWLEEPGRVTVTVDLSRAWGPAIKSYRRIFVFENSGRVTITDEIEATSAVRCDWQMHSPLAGVIGGTEARFRGMTLRVVEPAGAAPRWVTANNSGKKVRKLVVSMEGKRVRFVVELKRT